MLEDISSAIRATLYERVSSPFISSFFLSWCVFNYKILFILFSNMETRYKFYEIEVLQLQPQNFLGFDLPFYPYTFLYPFLTAIFYTLVFPFIEVVLTYVWMRGQQRVKSIKIRIEDETPVSQEKYTALLKKIRQMDKVYAEDLSRKDSECKIEIELAMVKANEYESKLKDLTLSYSELKTKSEATESSLAVAKEQNMGLLNANRKSDEKITKMQNELGRISLEVNHLTNKLKIRDTRIREIAKRKDVNQHLKDTLISSVDDNFSLLDELADTINIKG